MKSLAISLLLTSLAWAGGSSGTLSTYTTTWNGLTRTYGVYVPNKLPANPPLVFVLHPTVPNSTPSTPPPYFNDGPWEKSAVQNQFIVVFPLSTFNTRASSWYWDSFFLDFSFPVLPDDAGFLRSLVQNLTLQYNADPTRIFFTGMSSGAFMTHMMGATSSDLIAAVVAVEGQIEAEPPNATFVLPTLVAPVSVLDLQGDADTTVPYCGGPKTLWNEKLVIASLDQTADYWLESNGCNTEGLPQLCTNGMPTPDVQGLDVAGCNGGTEVEVVRRDGVGHVYGGVPIVNQSASFMLTHPKQ